jgi:hypothetical protein
MSRHAAAPRMLIDVTRLVARRLKARLPTGVDRVGLAYIERYALGRHGGLEPGPMARALLSMGPLQLVLPAQASQAVFRWLLGEPGATRTPWLALLAGLPRALAASLVRATGLAPEEKNAWLIHAVHSGLERPGWARHLRAAGARPLVVVHDLMPITHPQYFRAGEAARHERRMRHTLQWAHGLVANSHATLRALDTWAASQRLVLPAAAVAHLGSAGGSAAAEVPPTVAGSPPMAQPYFVVLGTLEPRKNHALLLKVWERLVQRRGQAATPRLVLIGQRGWEIESLARELERTPALQGVVVERPCCGDIEMTRWLRDARALLLPSFAEGFGLPLVEALALRVPVLASDLDVFRELAGPLPDYHDPLDGPAWLTAVEAYARPDSPARAAQLERLAGFHAPSWQSHFQAVDRLMLEAEAP